MYCRFLRFLSRLLSSRNSFLDPFGGPKDAKIDQKSKLNDVKNEESEKFDFLHPSHAKSLFLGSYGGQDRAPKQARSEFYNDQKW